MTLLLVTGCLNDDGDAVQPQRTLLAAIGSGPALVEWAFDYDGCRLTRAEWRRAMRAPVEPREYPNPLDVGPGAVLDFAYADVGLAPSSITVTDSTAGQLRVREYDLIASGGVVTELRGRTTTIGNTRLNDAPVSARYFYGESDLDSVSYTNGRTIALSYAIDGLLERADFRKGTSTNVEYYRFDRTLANPLAELPIRYLFEYPAYWSNHPITLGSYDLRTYEYQAGPNGYPGAVRDLTFGDSTAVSSFEYERVAECP